PRAGTQQRRAAPHLRQAHHPPVRRCQTLMRQRGLFGRGPMTMSRRLCRLVFGAALLTAAVPAGLGADEKARPARKTAVRKTPAGRPGLVVDPGGHTLPVCRVLFAPDGRDVISVSDDRTVRIWDVDCGQTRQVLRLPTSNLALAAPF